MNILKVKNLKTFINDEGNVILKNNRNENNDCKEIEEVVKQRVLEGKNRIKLFTSNKKIYEEFYKNILESKFENIDITKSKKIQKIISNLIEISQEEKFEKSCTKFAKSIEFSEKIKEWKIENSKKINEDLKYFREKYIEKKKKKVNNKIKYISKSIKKNTIKGNEARNNLLEEIEKKLLGNKEGNNFDDFFEESLKLYEFNKFSKRIKENYKYIGKGKSLYVLYKEHQKYLHLKDENSKTKEDGSIKNDNIQQVKLVDQAIRSYLENLEYSKFKVFSENYKIYNEKLIDKYNNENKITAELEKIKRVIKYKIQNKVLNRLIQKDKLEKIKNQKKSTTSYDLILYRIQDNMRRKMKYYSIEASNFRLLFLKNINEELKIIEKAKQLGDIIEEKNYKKYLENNNKYDVIIENKSINNIRNCYEHKNNKKNNDSKKIENTSINNIRNYEDNEEKTKQKSIAEIDVFIGEITKFTGEKDPKKKKKIKEEKASIKEQIIKDERDNLKKYYIENIMEMIKYNSIFKFLENREKDQISKIILPESQELHFLPSFRKILTNKFIRTLFEDNSLLYDNMDDDMYHAMKNFLQLIYKNIFITDTSWISKNYGEVYKKVDNEEKKRGVKNKTQYELKKILPLYDKNKDFSDYISSLQKLEMTLKQKRNKKANTKEKQKEIKEKKTIFDKLVIIFRELFSKYIKEKYLKEMLNVLENWNNNSFLDNEKMCNNIEKIIKKKIDEQMKEEINGKTLNFIYLLKNLKENSRNRLEHQMRKYNTDLKNLKESNIDENFLPFKNKIKDLLSLFKYFKNYKGNIIKKKLQNKEDIKNFVEKFYEKEALEYSQLDKNKENKMGNIQKNNSTKFYNRLFQDNEHIQLVTHVSKLINSLFYERIAIYFQDENEDLKIKKNDIEKFIELEPYKDFKKVEKEIENAIENKNINQENIKQIKNYYKYRESKSKVYLYDLYDCNRLINDVLSMLVKFNTCGSVIEEEQFKKILSNLIKDSSSLKKEIKYIKDVNFENDEKIKNAKNKTKNAENKPENTENKPGNTENKTNIREIRNYFAHNSFYHDENKLSILDYINLTRYANSYDRKQKNNVAKAIINYFDKNNIELKFIFSIEEGEHLIDQIQFRSKEIELFKGKEVQNWKNEKYKFHSDYKLKLLKTLFEYRKK